MADNACMPTSRHKKYQPQQGHPISLREGEVLDLILQGLTNNGIAAHLGISDQTVKNHLSNAYVKLGVQNRTQAALTWTVKRKRRQRP